jgi:hypothetical protein
MEPNLIPTPSNDKLAAILADPVLAAQSTEVLAEAWQAASAEARETYQWWVLAPVVSRAEAYAVYVAAADREAAASRSLGVPSSL